MSNKDVALLINILKLTPEQYAVYNSLIEELDTLRAQLATTQGQLEKLTRIVGQLNERTAGLVKFF